MKTIVLKQLPNVLSSTLHRSHCKTPLQNLLNQNKINVILILLFTILSTSQIQAQAKSPIGKTSGWMAFGTSGNESLLFLKTGEPVSGDDTFLEIKNDSEKDVSLKFIINFNNGQSQEGTVHITNDDKTPRIACANCNESIGQGIANWEFKEIQFK